MLGPAASSSSSSSRADCVGAQARKPTRVKQTKQQAMEINCKNSSNVTTRSKIEKQESAGKSESDLEAMTTPCAAATSGVLRWWAELPLIYNQAEVDVCVKSEDIGLVSAPQFTDFAACFSGRCLQMSGRGLLVQWGPDSRSHSNLLQSVRGWKPS